MENALAPNGKRPCPRSGLQARYQTAKQQQNSRVFDAGVTCNLLFIVAGKGLFISPKRVQKEFIIVVLADRKRGFLTFF